MLNDKLRHYLDWITFQLEALPRQLGIVRGCRDYRRFIILTTARSGSNFLRGLLNAHSQVIAFGELFRDPGAIGWDLPRYDEFLQSPRLRRLAQRDPAAFVEREVFKTFPMQTKAVGFKIFYYHAQDASRRDIWRYLRESRDISVIHLKRNNMLKNLLSLNKAFQTNNWTSTKGTREEKLVLSLDPEECLKHFTWAQNVKQEYDGLFADHSKIDVIYEDLAGDTPGEFARIQRFLGIDLESCKPTTRRQSGQPLSEAVSNYFELKERFKGSPWESFFED